MRHITLADGADFEGWRCAARELLHEGIAPAAVSWVSSGEASLFWQGGDVPPAASDPEPPAAQRPLADGERQNTARTVPAEFLPLAQALICHSDPQRYALAYRLLWRITHGERALLQLVTDPDVVRARNAEKNVRRDAHKMKAFLRFRETKADDGEPAGQVAGNSIYVAWFEPEHYIVERVAPFLVRRFTGMRWSVLTPYRSAHWDGTTLHYGPGAAKSDAPSDDRLEDYWRTYYASIFNPARLKVQAMKSEMPVKYWKNLPEARLIPSLIREALPRAQAMVEAEATQPKKKLAAAPARASEPIKAGSLETLRAEAKNCRACPLWEPATQTVFGEGPADARLMIVGEQPGDQEDLAGKPFIGPAGKLLDRALAEAGIDRSASYVTNAVKHFKFEQRGKIRLHSPPSRGEQRACHPWLEAEMARVRPKIILCLGATAAKALISPDFAITKERGQWFDAPDGARMIATVHPSYLLRLREVDQRERETAAFIDDLRTVAEALQTIAR